MPCWYIWLHVFEQTTANAGFIAILNWLRFFTIIVILISFLNQECWHSWFPRIAFVWEIGISVCMSLPSRLLITSTIIWALYDWLNKFYSFYMAAVVSVVSTCSLTIECIVETKLIRLSYVAFYIHFKSHCLKYL